MASRTNFGDHSMGAFRLKDMHDADYPGGVVVDPTPITAGEEICVLYNGLLANSGAKDMYLHYGYGDSTKWNAVQDVKMAKTGYGFVKTIRVPEVGTRMNFCFHDPANNWDNNNGLNWSFEVHNG
ncbi:carbohydrate-binding protein [Peptococcaceae bacterium 1198_IL3148]